MTFSFFSLSKRQQAILLIIGLSLGLNVMLAMLFFSSTSQLSRESVQQLNYPLISKRIFVEDQNDILVNFVGLRKELQTYVDQQPEKVSVYFEYLPSGVSIGVNEKESYLFASLLKVPLVMAVYKEVSVNQLDLSQSVTVKPEELNDLFGEYWKKGAGGSLTLEQAVDLVLIDSDNTAKNVLLNHIPLTRLEEVFDYLDIPKEGQEEGPIVTAKNYSSILRSLYLSSYLPKDKSHEILQKMTHAKHQDKLVAGVPSHIKVAHKIGVYRDKTTSLPEIYTDCGIVYAPLRPYILCLMTESDEATATKNFSTISRMVYTYVSQANK